MTNSGCGHYGGYIGEVGGYWDMSQLNCGTGAAWNSTAASGAAANRSSGVGFGANGYWFAAGPGLDPNYNGTEAEASSWGALQAQKAWALYKTHSTLTGPNGGYIIFMDVEEVGGAGDGWNERVNTSCTSSNASGCCAYNIAQHTVDGFINWIWNNTTLFHGVYSSPGEWSSIFGTGSASDFSGPTEAWTADWYQNCVQPGPLNWTQGSSAHCASNTANFFDSFSSSGNCAVAWQWSGNVNQTGPAGDYDQIDDSRFFNSLCP